jgi:hypothetical protein
MTIGAALLLIAAGAILRFAINTVSTHGVNLHTIGDILMIVGVIGLVLWVFVWGPWARGRRARTTEDRNYAAERPARDPYRDPAAERDRYRDPSAARDPYAPTERTYQDPYSR